MLIDSVVAMEDADDPCVMLTQIYNYDLLRQS